MQALEANQNILIDLEKSKMTLILQQFSYLFPQKNTSQEVKQKIKLISHPNCVIAILDLYGLVGFFGDKIILTVEERKNIFKIRNSKKKVHSI